MTFGYKKLTKNNKEDRKMQIVDIVIMVLLALFCLIGLICGFGKGLRFFSSGVFGIFITVVGCYILGSFVLKIPPVENAITGINSKMSGGGSVAQTLANMHIEIALYYLVFLAVVQVVRIVVSKLVVGIFEADSVIIKMINAPLGGVFFLGVFIVLTLLVFQIIYAIGGPVASKVVELLKDSVLKLDVIYANNPLLIVINIIKEEGSMPTVDIIAIISICLFCLIGIVAGFGKGLRFFTQGFFGVFIAIVICYLCGGFIANITPVKGLVDNLNTKMSGGGGFFKLLASIHFEMIVYYAVLFIIVLVLRIIAVKVVVGLFESNIGIMKVINAILGILFFLCVLIAITLISFQIIYAIGGPTAEKVVAALKESRFRLDILYESNPLLLIIQIFKIVIRKEVPVQAALSLLAI